MITVRLPDGNTAQFPDGTDPAVMEKALQDLHSADAKMEGEDRWHKVKLALQAPVKGAASLGALIGDLATTVPMAAMWPEELSGSESPVEAFALSKGLARMGEQPKTAGERYMASGLEGMGGGMVGAAGRMARNATIGGASGLAGEAGAQALDDNPLAALIGAVAGGSVAGGALRGGERVVGRAVKPNVEALARETLGDVPEQDLAEAIARMGEWRKEGFRGTAAQALDRPSNLDKLQDLLASHPSGKETQATLRHQPLEVAMASDQAMARIGGRVQSVPAVANAMQETATTAIEDARRQASAAWRQAAGDLDEQIPPEAVAALDRELRALAAQYPNQSAADMINDARKALIDPAGKSRQTAKADPWALPEEPEPNYLSNALQIKEALEDRMSTFGSRELNTTGTDAKMLRRAQEVREAVGSVFKEHAPKLREADRAYNLVMTDAVDPLKQSAVGGLAGRRGYQEDAQAPVAKLNALFERGTVNPKASDIRYVASVLNKHDKQVFPNAVTTWMADKIQHLKVRDSEAQFSPETAKMIHDALFGSPAKAQGLRDMLAGVAEAQGRKPEEVVRGFERYMDLVDAAAKRPANVSGASVGDLEELAGTSKPAAALRMLSFFAPSHVATGYAGFTSRRVLSDVDKLFTTPEGLETLAALSKTVPRSKLAEDILTSFRAATASSPVLNAGE